jgi:hypothetical protein
MSPFNALFPTHAALASIPPEGKQAWVLPPQTPDGIHIHKYVIVLDPIAGREYPILFPREIQHSYMVPLGHRAVSAGHLVIYNSSLTVSAVGSTTLNLEPRPQDRAILESFLSLPSLKPQTSVPSC